MKSSAYLQHTTVVHSMSVWRFRFDSSCQLFWSNEAHHSATNEYDEWKMCAFKAWTNKYETQMWRCIFESVMALFCRHMKKNQAQWKISNRDSSLPLIYFDWQNLFFIYLNFTFNVVANCMWQKIQMLNRLNWTLNQCELTCTPVHVWLCSLPSIASYYYHVHLCACIRACVAFNECIRR